MLQCRMSLPSKYPTLRLCVDVVRYCSQSHRAVQLLLLVGLPGLHFQRFCESDWLVGFYVLVH